MKGATARKSQIPLAVCGAEPRLPAPVFVGTPNQPERDQVIDMVNQALDRNWLSNFGPNYHDLSAKLRSITGAKYAIPVSNGTVGLELCLKAIDRPGEVIVPSFTFIATAHAASWLGLEPVFCDVDRKTHGMDPNRLEGLVTENTAAIMPVHLWGNPCDVTEIERIGKKHGVPVIYDSAHALGASVAGTMIGNFGSAEVFSFHATKFINAFEGGAVITNDSELAKKIVYLSNFGFSRIDKVDFVGTNAKLNEISCGMGILGLNDMASIIEVNKQCYDYYLAHLRDIPGLDVYRFDVSKTPNYQYVIVEVDEREFGMTRDQLLTVLHAENIYARRYFYPGAHGCAPYKSASSSSELSVTDDLNRRVLCLPTGPGNADFLSAICDTVSLAQASAGQLLAFIGEAAVQLEAGIDQFSDIDS